jgi:hypothetical protein
LELYFIFYKFSNIKNGQVQAKLLQASSLYCALYAVGEQPWPAIAGRSSYGRGKGREKKDLTGVAAVTPAAVGSA